MERTDAGPGLSGFSLPTAPDGSAAAGSDGKASPSPLARLSETLSSSFRTGRRKPLTSLIPRPAGVPLPPAQPLSSDKVFGKDGKPLLENIKRHFVSQGLLEKEDARRLIEETARVLTREPNVLRISSPITVVGDIHGQFYDLICSVFEIGGDMSAADTQYLFLGDYVDRGMFSCEVMLYLCAVKLCYPTRFLLLRGNHECRHITEYFSFKTECLHKYDDDLYEEFCVLFDCMPLAAVVDNRYFCVHGGIAPDLRYVTDINTVNRFRELPSTGLMGDIIWSDPVDPAEDDEDIDFVPNTQRGTAWEYSYIAAVRFLRTNALASIIRGHEVQEEGYKLYKTLPGTGFPTVTTIFSAPNYCDVYENQGAVLRLSKTKFDIKRYMAVEHPYVLPFGMNAISWSIPFLAEKIMEALLTVLTLHDPDDIGADASPALDMDLAAPVSEAGVVAGAEEDGDEDGEELSEKDAVRVRQTLRAKVRALTNVLRVYQTLRHQAQLVSRAPSLASQHTMLPSELATASVQEVAEMAAPLAKTAELDRDVDYKCPPLSPEEKTMEAEEAALPPGRFGIRRSSSRLSILLVAELQKEALDDSSHSLPHPSASNSAPVSSSGSGHEHAHGDGNGLWSQGHPANHRTQSDTEHSAALPLLLVDTTPSHASAPRRPLRRSDGPCWPALCRLHCPCFGLGR